MKKAKKTIKKLPEVKFLKTRRGYFLTSVLSFIAMWLMFLKATDTGSLQQYGLLFLFLYFGFNRLYLTAFPPKKNG